MDDHTGGEDDPEWFGLNYGETKSTWSWIDGIVVGGVRHDVETTAFAAECVLAETDTAIG